MNNKNKQISKQKIFYVKTIIISSLIIIIALILFSSLPGLYRSYKNYRIAQRTFYLNDVSDDLFTAVGNFAFERGRVNVVLNDSGPVDGMEKNRDFILARRKEGEKSLSDALGKLRSLHSPVINEKVADLQGIKGEIAEIRKRAAANLIIPKEKREAGLAEKWFASMTGYIEDIEALLVTISRNISDSDGIISRYSDLKHETLALRNTAGPEMSILSATMLSGKPIAPDLLKKIDSRKIITEHHFQTISFLCDGFSTNVIPDALDNLKRIYYSGYIPYRNVILPLSKTGGTYPYTQEEFLDHGVKALNAIADFMNTIVSETKKYADRTLQQRRDHIFIQTLTTGGSLIIAILVIIYLNLKVIRPIGLLTSTVHRLAKRDPDIEVPLVDVKNEIGEMARALEIFKGMSNQLEKDLQIIKTAEEKLHKAHSELEVKVRQRTSELASSNRELLRYTEKLEKLNRELTDFIFAASHDLQEPLRKIQTFCDMALRLNDSSVSNNEKEYIEIAINSANRMRTHIQDLLKYSKIASNPEQMEETDLKKIVRIAAELHREQLEAVHGKVEIGDMPAIQASEDQVLMLFQNLIDNAIKFRGQKSPRIHVTAAKKNGYCEIEVKDNGIGFDSRYADRIFRPFQRLHNRKRYEGSGMGLAICRKIVEWHNGNIRAESQTGSGSKFIILLPYKQGS